MNSVSLLNELLTAGFVVGVLVYAGTGLLRSRRQRPGVLPRWRVRPQRLPLWEIVGAVTIWGALLGVGAALGRLVTTGDWLPLALVIAVGLACWFTIWAVVRHARAGRGGGALSVTLVALLLAGCTGPFSADLRQCARPSAAAWSLVPLVGGASAAALEAEKVRCMAERGWERRGFTYGPRDPAAPPPPSYTQSAARCAAAYGEEGPRFESCMVTAGWPLAEVQARGRAAAEPPAPK